MQIVYTIRFDVGPNDLDEVRGVLTDQLERFAESLVAHDERILAFMCDSGADAVGVRVEPP